MNQNYHTLKCPVNATGDRARPLWAGPVYVSLSGIGHTSSVSGPRWHPGKRVSTLNSAWKNGHGKVVPRCCP